METDAYLDHLEREGLRLAEAARLAGVGAAVPACAGWAVADLLVHTAKVFRHKTYALEHRLLERPSGDDWKVAEPGPDGAVDWYEDELRRLLAALRSIDPAEPVWTFSTTETTAAFWPRRMAHEAVIHRVDAEAAVGAVTPIPTDLALDGVDEVLDVFLAPWAAPSEGEPVTVHLHATDGEGEWLVTLGPGGAAVERGHAKGDAALRGTASDLDLWLWGRSDGGALERFGDPTAVDRLRAALAAVT